MCSSKAQNLNYPPVQQISRIVQKMSTYEIFAIIGFATAENGRGVASAKVEHNCFEVWSPGPETLNWREKNGKGLRS